jgi:hypothetical protein
VAEKQSGEADQLHAKQESHGIATTTGHRNALKGLSAHARQQVHRYTNHILKVFLIRDIALAN